MFVPILVCLLLLRLGEFAATETGCPEPEDIAPCKCDRPLRFRLTCSGLETPDALQQVFSRSKRYNFEQMEITDSVMQYIPSDIFEKVTVKELTLSNLILGTMFSDLRVDIPDIREMNIINTTVLQTITSQNFTRFTGLKEINIFNSTVPTVPKLSLPTSIQQFSLSESGTKHITHGAFSNVPNLVLLDVSFNRLKTLSRDSFPRPFFVKVLSFYFNQISFIPGGMFEDMPRLRSVYLSYNALSVLPEAVFGGTYPNRLYITLDENPLQCDCQLRWLIEVESYGKYGTCDGPEELKGRKLQDLTPAEISC